MKKHLAKRGDTVNIEKLSCNYMTLKATLSLYNDFFENLYTKFKASMEEIGFKGSLKIDFAPVERYNANDGVKFYAEVRAIPRELLWEESSAPKNILFKKQEFNDVLYKNGINMVQFEVIQNPFETYVRMTGYYYDNANEVV
jgi:hypothetical protein